jgi:hypothetical protein
VTQGTWGEFMYSAKLGTGADYKQGWQHLLCCIVVHLLDYSCYGNVTVVSFLLLV